jgi:hypothetical protein
LIESEVPLRSITLVAASDKSRRGRLIAVSSMNGKRAKLTVPRNFKLRSGEQLYFEVSSRRKIQSPVKITVRRDRP